MQANHSKVNFRKLVHDLADMYQDATFDVVLTELVANALDAKASAISVSWDDLERVLVVMDDGKGMDTADFEQYHDFAAELKTRGEGIGFAGVGAKISFNIADQVITETRHNNLSNASDWRWHSDGSLQWSQVHANRLNANGTRVEVHFNLDAVLPDVDSDYLMGVLERHYLPLFVDEFVRSYAAANLYPTRPRFIVNGVPVPTDNLTSTAALTKRTDIKVRAGNRQVGWGAIGVSERDCPVGADAYGVLICTHGKVIKPELFGQSTGLLGSKLFGIVEIPDLIQYLTTNKSDLKGGRSKGLNQLLDPVREELKKFLAQHGIAITEPQRNQLSSRLERELSKMVKQLPELQDFDGLLRKSRSLRKSDDGDTLASERKSEGENREPQTRNETGDGQSKSGDGKSREPDKGGDTRTRRPRSRRSQGPRVAFEEHPDRGETAWLDSSTIVINSGHAAYRNRTTSDQARLTYCMFAMGVALDKAELGQAVDGTSYVDKFVTVWGQS